MKHIRDNINLVMKSYRNMANYINTNRVIDTIYEKCSLKEKKILENRILNLDLEGVRLWVKDNRVKYIPYEEWTVRELRREAASFGIKNYLCMPKAMLIYALKKELKELSNEEERTNQSNN